MKILLLFIFSLSLFAETFTSPDKKTSVSVYGVLNHTCSMKSDQVSYTIYDNQTDKDQIESCALTYSHRRCGGFGVTDQGTCTMDWKEITREKVLYLSKNKRSFCFGKGKELTERLEKKGFRCTESGIN